MASERPFSKKTSTKYALVHRPQDDPLIHDENTPSQVLTQIAGPSSSQQADRIKTKRIGDLEQDFKATGEALPENDEVAAEHGIRFNDEYDYLQHLRDLGQGSGDSTWLESRSSAQRHGKGRQNLEDALRDVTLNDGDNDSQSHPPTSDYGGRVAHTQPSWERYQEQQDIPDEIAGFQPDMDPRLREVLEALDDEAFVDDDQDLFDELAVGGEEVDRDIWESLGAQDDDDGWESDDTAKAINDDATSELAHEPLPQDQHDDGDFLESLAKAKAQEPTVSGLSQTGLRKPPLGAPSAAFTADTSATGRRKKRKGALTSSTGFSMTSSALARTEALSTLDSKFDKVLDTYMDDINEDEEITDDNVSAISGLSRMTGGSKMSFASRTDTDDRAPPLSSNAAFATAMDEFLGGSGKKGKKMKKGGKQDFWGQQGGIEQLNEIRRGLGPARVNHADRNVKV
ncbi:MAG: hypothetical protein Q9159_001949 [Coniocarpon cinnabarinum]